MRAYVLSFALSLALALPAAAQHAHGEKGPNGGQMEDVAGVHVELLTAGPVITVNVFDEKSKAVSTKGFTASVLVTAGTDRETLNLTPEGENALKGTAKKAIAPGASVSVTVKTAAGKSGQAKFKN